MTTLRHAQGTAARAGIARRTEELIRASGALREGHVALENGRHGDPWVERFVVVSHPAVTSELCRFWAAEAGTPDGGSSVDVVAGPSPGGVILAWETARQLGVRTALGEEAHDAADPARPGLRRGSTIAPGERVLLVDDIHTTGRSLLAMLGAVEALGGEIVGCRVLVDRSGNDRAVLASPTTGRRYGLRSLWRLSPETYAPGPATCPRCAAGEPIHAPADDGPAPGRGPDAARTRMPPAGAS